MTTTASSLIAIILGTIISLVLCSFYLSGMGDSILYLFGGMTTLSVAVAYFHATLFYRTIRISFSYTVAVLRVAIPLGIGLWMASKSGRDDITPIALSIGAYLWAVYWLCYDYMRNALSGMDIHYYDRNSTINRMFRDYPIMYLCIKGLAVIISIYLVTKTLQP